jgi:L-amino acid N-acyltransferase YncA
MRVRKAVLTDAKGIAKVHGDSWKTTYLNIIPDEYLNNLSYERREQLWKDSISNGGYLFVAENENGNIVGFSSGGKERSGKYKGFKGELYAIYILKEYQRQGIGKLLVKPFIHELNNMKINSMLVLVLEDNNSSCYIYESLGGQKIDLIDVEIAGKKLKEVVYGWDDIKTVFHQLK